MSNALRTLTIRLADDEWGNPLMCDVAAEALRSGLADIVMVIEHAGWWMEYTLVDGEVRIVASANCGSKCPDIRRWYDSVKHLPRQHVPGINRNELQPA